MSRIKNFALLSLVVAVVAGLLCAPNAAFGRALYCKTFIAEYKNVEEAKKTSCKICHVGESKKDRNDYGQALAKLIQKEEKDGDKVKEVLKKVEAEKSSVEGRTFGDLLKDGKLPASK